MRNGVYAHPWDLAELARRGGLECLRALGFGDVALAVAYHAGRWLTPQRPGGFVRDLEDGTVHFRPTASYGQLTPLPSQEVVAGELTPLQRLCVDADACGMESTAWTVLFHNSRLGRGARSSCVRNAVGDIYDHALCPARPEVQAYGAALVEDVARHPGLSTIELEAAGWLGYRHGSHHHKASLVVDDAVDFLLSYCFCDVCRQGLGARGVDPAVVAHDVEAALDEALQRGDVMNVPDPGVAHARCAEAVGGEALSAMLDHRAGVQSELLRSLRARVPLTVRMALHVCDDPLATGSQLGQSLELVAPLVDELVVTHYGESAEAIVAKWGGRANPGAPVRLGVWPKAPQFRSDEDVTGVAELVRQGAIAAIRIYHLGLLPWATIERVAAVMP